MPGARGTIGNESPPNYTSFAQALGRSTLLRGALPADIPVLTFDDTAHFVSALRAALDVSEPISRALERIARAIVEHLHAGSAAIWTVGAQGANLELQACAGDSSFPAVIRQAIEKWLSDEGRVASEQSPYLTPLLVDDRLVGVLAVSVSRPFVPLERELMSLAAAQMALALEHRRVELALTESDARMSFAFEAAKIGVFEINLDTGWSIWSDSLRTMAGVGPDYEASRENFLALVHPADRRRVERISQGAVEHGTDLKYDCRMLRPDGEIFWAATRGRVIRAEDGRPRRIIGVRIDITDQKLLEAQLMQAQKMDAVGKLAGGVAHDFNNLLTAILGYVNLIKEQVTDNPPLVSDLEEVERAAGRATGLTRQLLAFSRKQIMQPRVLDLNAVIHETSKMLGRLVGENIKVDVNLSPTLGRVLVDAGQMEQVLMNLAVNSRDAMPSGGTLTIETQNVQLTRDYHRRSVVQTGSYVMVAVSDTGIGISPETQSRIFEPFFTTKEPGQGTGLGLATVYGIVKQSGGFIWVYSEPGHGSTFKIYLPVVQDDEAVESLAAPTSAATTPASPAPGGRGETVLLVEDEKAVRVLARIFLQRAGYKVLEAEGPSAAIELASQTSEPIALLLTDVVMPGGSGTDLYAQLSSVQPDLKVIYMSGYTDATAIRHGLLKPGVAFLQKPFTAQSLGVKVQEVIGTPVRPH